MATDKYPNQNVNMPIPPARLEALRSRLAPPGAPPPSYPPAHGGGSRRQVRPGEWVDDRTVEIGGPASPSSDTPPPFPEGWDEKGQRKGKSVVYNDTFVYNVILFKACVVDGRMLSPAKSYQMVGGVLNTITDSVLRADSIADIPQDPDAPPSE